jgi:hypothetical protein
VVPHEDEIRSVERSAVEAALRPSSYPGGMDAHDELFYRLNDPYTHTQAMAS